MDPVLLSQIQFAFVVSFHAVFPVFSIGIASYIFLLEFMHFRTGKDAWAQLSQLWTKIFAIAFGMGVVSGIVMSFQFGTNWSNFAYATANFLGPVLSYEVVTAFFLEAAFLGVLLFGRDKVPKGVHLFSAFMVAFGTLLSSFWILAANSWMHTPAGIEWIDGIVHVTSWSEAIFNASFPYRLGHMVLASFLTGSFVVAGVSSWYIMKNYRVAENTKALSMCLWMILVLAPAQAVLGDYHGLNTLENQPTKLAAMEGNWETGTGVPLLLFALPSSDSQENLVEIGIPKLASLILTHHADGEVPGVSEAPKAEQPPVSIVFWSFRIMVGMGMLMILAGLWGLYQRVRGRLTESSNFHRLMIGLIPAPFIAVVAGWVTTESGRSPWLVYGAMTQAQGVTPSLTGGMALASLVGYVLVYAVIYAAGVYYLVNTVRQNVYPQKSLAAFDTPGEHYRHGSV